MTTRSTTRSLAALAAGLLLATTGAACSAGSDDSNSSSSDAGAGGRAAADSDVASAAASAPSLAGASGSRAQGAAATPDVTQQQVVSTGSVQLAARDVGAAAAAVRRITATAGGTLGRDSTRTDENGEPRSAHLVLRVPVAGFADALDALEQVGTLVSSDSDSQDVTTQVLDTRVRVEAERRSIDRIQELFDRATSITDIVKIESELSTRQAALASLEQQQRYLADQTALSTIDVRITRPAAAPVPHDTDRATGFLAGLGAGWHGLRAAAVVAATVLGALLPWLVVVALLGAPAWALVRRHRRSGRQGASPESA